MRQHRLLTFYVKRHARAQLVDQGYSDEQVSDAMSGLDYHDIQAAASFAGPETVSGVDKLGKIGDGSILQAIMDFLKSPQGQALIAALIQMLVGLIPK